MNDNEEHCVSSRRPTLPPISNRTLHHPSFLPLYMTADFALHHTVCNDQPIHPIIPAEFFYSDPTMSCGTRIPNIVTELRVFDCFQLSTPPPIMSTCMAPPALPDPFRSGPHPTRDLGSFTFKVNPFPPAVQPGQVILQLTQEEDQAITNLLKLHHQEPLQSDDTLIAPQNNLNPVPFLGHPEPVDSTSAQEEYKLLCTDLRHPMEVSCQSQQGRHWSETELEAANTLLSGFSLTEKTLCKSHNNSVVYLPVLEGSFLPPRLPSLSSDSKAKGVSGDFSEVEGRTLSDTEGDAVHVLLSLGDTGALDTMQ